MTWRFLSRFSSVQKDILSFEHSTTSHNTFQVIYISMYYVPKNQNFHVDMRTYQLLLLRQNMNWERDTKWDKKYAAKWEKYMPACITFKMN